MDTAKAASSETFCSSLARTATSCAGFSVHRLESPLAASSMPATILMSTTTLYMAAEFATLLLAPALPYLRVASALLLRTVNESISEGRRQQGFICTFCQIWIEFEPETAATSYEKIWS